MLLIIVIMLMLLLMIYIGAAGGIGQPLALLLKNSSAVGSLSLYDLVNTPGVAADLSHINSKAQVVGYAGKDKMGMLCFRVWILSISQQFFCITTQLKH